MTTQGQHMQPTQSNNVHARGSHRKIYTPTRPTMIPRCSCRDMFLTINDFATTLLATPSKQRQGIPCVAPLLHEKSLPQHTHVQSFQCVCVCGCMCVWLCMPAMGSGVHVCECVRVLGEAKGRGVVRVCVCARCTCVCA